MPYIPSPPWGIIDLSLREDGSFGPHDPMHWPQIYSLGKDTRFLCMMPREPRPGRGEDIMWRQFTPDDFETKASALEMSFGRIAVGLRTEMLTVVNSQLQSMPVVVHDVPDLPNLRLLLLSYRTALQRLNFQASWRDTLRAVCDLQRLHRMTVAWLGWQCAMADLLRTYTRCELKPNVMGAFTTDPTAVIQLDSAGIPVWHFRPVESLDRPTCILEWVEPVPPECVPSSHGPFSGNVVHTSVAGASHLSYIMGRSFGYVDIESSPMPAQWEPVNGTLTSKGSGSTVRSKPVPAGMSFLDSESLGPTDVHRKHTEEDESERYSKRWTGQIR